MPSTFTQNTGIEKPGDGEQAGLWGDTVNLSSDIIDRALNGSTSIALTSTSYTLTTAGGTLSEGQYSTVTFTGTPGGTATVTVAPSTAQKTYFIRNSTDQSVVITQGSGGNATIAAGRSAVVVCTGAGASSAVFDVTAVMNTATSANTANAVVQRDGSGGFSAAAGTFSGNLTVDTSTLFVDASTNTVGIGTASPQYTLDVFKVTANLARVSNGSSGGTPSNTHGDFVVESNEANMGIQLLGTATSNQRILFGDPDSAGVGQVTYDHTNNYMSFVTSNSERVRIDVSGNVGIGTANPQVELDVLGDGLIGRYYSTTSANAYIRFDNTSSTNPYIGTLNGIGTFGNSDANPIRFNTNNAERVRILSNGNVGIGTTNPQSELEVSGAGDTIRSTTANASSNFMSFYDATGRKGYFGYGGTSEDVTLANERNGYFRINTNGAEGLRITSAGNVGLGVSAPSEKLHVNGAVRATGLNLSGTAVTATAAELNYTDGVTSNIQTQLNGKASTSTSVSAGAGLTGGGSLAANRTISHADTSSQGSVNNSGATVIQDVTLDTYGHVTALGSTTLSLGTFGVTSTAAELNKLDGFTGVAADLNYARDLRATGVTTAEFDKLDGLTATTTELNYTDGVTSNIQTQLNSKMATASYPDLVAIEGLNSVGIAVRTASNSWAQRSVTGSAGITVTNGSGASGNIVVSGNLSLDVVGCYALCAVNTLNHNVVRPAGSSIAGSALNWANVDGDRAGGVPSGTWRLMGAIPVASTTASRNTSVFLRIA